MVKFPEIDILLETKAFKDVFPFYKKKQTNDFLSHLKIYLLSNSTVTM